MQDNLCRIPVTATYTVYKGSSEPVLTAAEYVSINADKIAAFLVDKLGVDAVFGEGVAV